MSVAETEAELQADHAWSCETSFIVAWNRGGLCKMKRDPFESVVGPVMRYLERALTPARISEAGGSHLARRNLNASDDVRTAWSNLIKKVVEGGRPTAATSSRTSTTWPATWRTRTSWRT